MAKEIYGVDPSKKITARDVRDAITKCFIEAHKQVLEEAKEYGPKMSEEDFEEIKKMNVEALIKKFLNESGGDYDNPAKEDLIRVCDKLSDFAKNFRSPGVIKKHYQEIMSLIEKL